MKSNLAVPNEWEGTDEEYEQVKKALHNNYLPGPVVFFAGPEGLKRMRRWISLRRDKATLVQGEFGHVCYTLDTMSHQMGECCPRDLQAA